jgi:hypothetical protein
MWKRAYLSAITTKPTFTKNRQQFYGIHSFEKLHEPYFPYTGIKTGVFEQLMNNKKLQAGFVTYGKIPSPNVIDNNLLVPTFWKQPYETYFPYIGIKTIVLDRLSRKLKGTDVDCRGRNLKVLTSTAAADG